MEVKMDIFRGQSFLEFTGRFKNDQDCRDYLSGIKWNEGDFKCRKCGHGACQVRSNGSRT